MSCHAFGSTPVADAQSLAQSLAADTLGFVRRAPMHAVIKSPVRGTHIGLALSISAIPGRQLTHRNSSGCALLLQNIYRNRSSRPRYPASQCMDALSGKFSRCSSRGSRSTSHSHLATPNGLCKDSRLALASQSCDRDMVFVRLRLQKQKLERSASAREIADSCSCAFVRCSMASIDVWRSNFRESR